jgi:cell division septal protein FtsQ
MKYRVRKRQKPKRKIFLSMIKSRFFWVFVFLMLVLTGLCYVFFFSNYLEIKNIEISGNRKIDNNEIRNVISEEINHKLLGFLPKNIFLVNLGKINNNILEEFPVAFKTEINRKLFNSLAVSIEERIAIAVWCGNNGCFNIDSEGVIFEKGQVNNFIVKKEGDFSIGEKVINKDYLKNIIEIYRGMGNEFNIEVEEIHISNNRKIVVKMKENWEVYFNEDKNDIAEQIVNLKLVLEHKIPAESRGSLEYIDLRFGNKVYYKYRNSGEVREDY